MELVIILTTVFALIIGVGIEIYLFCKLAEAVKQQIMIDEMVNKLEKYRDEKIEDGTIDSVTVADLYRVSGIL